MIIRLIILEFVLMRDPEINPIAIGSG